MKALFITYNKVYPYYVTISCHLMPLTDKSCGTIHDVFMIHKENIREYLGIFLQLVEQNYV